MKKRNLLLIIAIILLVCALVGCASEEAAAVPEEDETLDEIDELDDVMYPVNEDDVFEIETEYAKLVFPSEWKDQLRTEVKKGEEYTVSFYGSCYGTEIKLFDFVFDCKEGLGTIELNGEKVNIDLIMYDIDEQKLDFNQNYCLSAMQEYAFKILNYLTDNYQFEEIV